MGRPSTRALPALLALLLPGFGLLSSPATAGGSTGPDDPNRPPGGMTFVADQTGSGAASGGGAERRHDTGPIPAPPAEGLGSDDPMPIPTWAVAPILIGSDPARVPLIACTLLTQISLTAAILTAITLLALD